MTPYFLQFLANNFNVNDIPRSVSTFIGHECLVTNIWNTAVVSSAVKVFNGTASGQLVNQSFF